MNTETAKKPISYAEFMAMSPWDRAFERIKARGEGVPYIANGVKYTPIWIYEDEERKWVQVSYRKQGKVTHGMVYPGDAILIELQPVTSPT
ncbi:MAG: hypothetical protein ACYC2K_01720 [Gemmatimonadales bacterium]